MGVCACLWACWAQEAQAATLPLISVEEGGQTQAWWVQDEGGLSPLERRLVEALEGRAVEVVDPAKLGQRPKVSKVYKTVRLSQPNALNLAGLHGADAALVGSAQVVELEDLGPHKVVELRVSVELWAMPSGSERLRVSVSRVGLGASAQEAREEALGLVGEDLAELVAGALKTSRAPAGVARVEPFVRVAALPDLGAMRAVEKGLGGLPGVRRVRLAWASQGVVAFDLNPDEEDAQGWVQETAKALGQSPPPALRLALDPNEPALLRASVAPKAQ